MTYLRELLSTRELLLNLVARDIKGQYRRTALGQLWSLINPIATMAVYSIVFGLIFRAGPPPGDPSGVDIYALWLMSGLLVWTYFARVVNRGLDSIVSNATLIKKVYFPRMHLPLAVALSVGFTWCFELGVLIVALVIVGGMPLPWIPILLCFMVLVALFAEGLSMLLAIGNVYFRDTKHFTAIAIQMWMYLTPIIYPIRLVENATAEHPWALTLYKLNPMYHFTTAFRDLLYDNRLPTFATTLWCTLWASVTAWLGYVVFSRFERRLAELL